MIRTVVISENMGGRLDEGIRKFATAFVAGMSEHGAAWGLTPCEPEPWPSPEHIRRLDADKLFRSGEMVSALRGLAPDVIVYVPSASGTLFSFIRARVLKHHVPDAHVAMIVTQRRDHTLPVRSLLRRLAPDSLFCQSLEALRYFDRLGIPARFLPSGVDTDLFRPVDPATKADLRLKYGLPLGEYLVFHAGHLKPGRNTGLLAQLQGVGRKGVMLAGSSMGRNAQLQFELEERGVIVIDRYIEAVEELYQAMDCYLFPVREEDSAMEFPLSVLEAMACNLPVVSYPYGGLPLALVESGGLVFREDEIEIMDTIREMKGVRAATRDQAEELTWGRVAGRLLEEIGMKSDVRAIATAV